MEKIKPLQAALTIFLISLTVLVVVFTGNELSRRNYLGLNQPRTIEVSGEEVIFEKPDEAEITFSVATQGRNYLDAVEKNSSQMKRVTDHLKNEGIQDENLRTLNFSVSPRYENIEDNGRTRREIVGYEVRNDLRVSVDDLSVIDALIAGTIEAGANQVQGLVFSVSNEEELKKEARDKAIANARKEAQRIASSLGVKLGRVVDFSETRYFYPSRVAMEDMIMEAGESMQVPIEAGENEISSSVRVKFEIR